MQLSLCIILKILITFAWILEGWIEEIGNFSFIPIFHWNQITSKIELCVKTTIKHWCGFFYSMINVAVYFSHLAFTPTYRICNFGTTLHVQMSPYNKESPNLPQWFMMKWSSLLQSLSMACLTHSLSRGNHVAEASWKLLKTVLLHVSYSRKFSNNEGKLI